MFYIVYKITNLINEKIYIGVHKTENLDDGYMGSGTHLRRSQEKYGIENFKKEYLAIFDNSEDMFNMESEIVNEDFINREDTYNMKLGGFGGWDYINKKIDKNIIATRNKNNSPFGADFYKGRDYLRILLSERFKKLNSENKLNRKVNYGLKHSEETKQKIGKANSIHQTGEKNSMFGMMWIHNLELKESKRISKGSEIPEGWIKGRKMKF